MANPRARSRSVAAPVAVVVTALLAGGLGWYVIARDDDSDQVAVSAASPEPSASAPQATSDVDVVDQSPSAATPGATRVPGTPGAVTPGAGAKPVKGNLSVDTSRPSVAITSLPPVKVGAGATIGTGVVVTVGAIDWVDVKANGPGEIAGKGAKVLVTLENTSGAAFDLSSVAVNASYPNGTPVSPNGSPPAKELTGSLASGASATGVYLFTLTAGATDRLNVEVSSGAAPGIAVITG